MTFAYQVQPRRGFYDLRVRTSLTSQDVSSTEIDETETSSIALTNNDVVATGAQNRFADMWDPDLMQRQQIIIKEFGQLEKDWDSYGGSVISQSAIQHAVDLVSKYQVPPPDFLTPTAGGGVAFEWGQGNNFLALEILSADHVEIAYCVNEEVEWAGAYGDMPINDLLEVFQALGYA